MAEDSVPSELKMTRYSGPAVTPCPACLAASPNGDVYVGVDLLGSLGKGPSRGRIIKLVDHDNDGKADDHSVYAHIDNPRGLIPVGDRLYVLHTEIPEDTGVLTGMHLSVLEDLDHDGVADGPPRHLVENLSVAESNRKRGADHTTNGIQMGIDGWIYIAVGDFGMVDARGTDGRTLTMLGGGIIRVRPDGTELEVYTHGLRNIYDIAIDPYLNIFTRGNTNDGGGWNIRFIHNIQSAEYGYPVLFKNFTDEIIPALADLGGGSGTGALFFQEPGWPEKYNNVPMMCDWGRSHLFIHRVTPDGAGFTQEEERFIQLSQITDAASDASGRLYLGAWDGAGFSGNPDRGYVVQVVPRDWEYRPFPALNIATLDELVDLLRSESATARLHAQQELLSRGEWAMQSRRPLQELAADSGAALYSRVAAIFTLKQLLGYRANGLLAGLSRDPSIREFALRAITDRKSGLRGAPVGIFHRGLEDPDPRVKVAAAVGLGRLGNPEAAVSLLAAANPPGADPFEVEPEEGEAGPAFTSDEVRGTDVAQVDVDITGFTEMYLAIADAGDGTGHDHGAWFEPVLVRADGSEVALTDIEWKSASGGWGSTLVNKDCTGKPLKMADGSAVKHGIGSHSVSVIAWDLPEPFVRFRSRAGIASSAGGNGSVRFVVSSSSPSFGEGDEGPHATPNSEIILPHVAVQSLVDLGASSACVAAVGTGNERAALWALRYMHEPRVVHGLISKYEDAKSSLSRRRIASTLIRLYHREQEYDGSWWWGTRPDTRGPYYRTETWDGSAPIESFVRSEWEKADEPMKRFLYTQLEKHRVKFDGIEMQSPEAEVETEDEIEVDLAAIAGKEGEVGEMAVEDVLVAIMDLKGDAARGKELFTQQGCIACHTLDRSQTLKGPFMGHIGGIMNREQIAEAILKPNASISQGFATVLITTKQGAASMGFISRETADEVEIRDIAGNVTVIGAEDIAGRQEMETSMMPPGLASALSLEEFASLVSFLANQKD